jgi:hypothetical protein
MYKAESSLVREFVRQLRTTRSPWGIVQVTREFSYQRGCTDVVAVTAKEQQVVAFEAKLLRWRNALQQAYRNTCFAHSSFVVLPQETAGVASKFRAEFEKRNVGLCYLEGEKIVVVYRPQVQAPIEPWLSEAATAAAVRTWQYGSARTGIGGPKDLPRTSDAICVPSR